MATNTEHKEQANLQRILEQRIKRHGTVFSYRKGCRCERCKKAVSVSNKKSYDSYSDAIKKSASLRNKYSIECRNWVEEFFPEVAEQLKNAVIERQNDGF